MSSKSSALMDPDELERRLSQGEKAADLVVEKWERLWKWLSEQSAKPGATLENTSKDKWEYASALTCAYCYVTEALGCTVCPVNRASVQSGCGATPWQEFYAELRNERPSLSKLRDIARKELSFLRAVRQRKGRKWLQKHGYLGKNNEKTT